jgi:hypothetical protein
MLPVARDTPQTLGSRSPVRLWIPGFFLSKVSQKIAALPNCMPQLPATGPDGGFVGVDPPPDDPPPDAELAEAEQVAVAPPLEPPQLQVHGPEPATDDAVPAEQRLAEGLVDAVVPFADPHTPLTGAGPAFTATVALAGSDVPPLPLHVKVYVVVFCGETVRVPLGDFAPDHPPEAVHEVASAEDQFMVETLPDDILVGLAEIATVGVGVGEGVGEGFAEPAAAKIKSMLATTGG